MRKKLLVVCGLFALVGTIAVAAVLGIAGVGKAASTNTCALVGTPPAPNCFSVSVDPMFVTSGQTGLINAKFRNIFGNATATHTVIKITLPETGLVVPLDGVTTTGRPASCPQLANVITCDFGNVPSGTTVHVLIQFTSSVAAGNIPVSGNLTYAEGNGSNGNDSFDATGTAAAVSGTNKGGYCTTAATKTVKNKTVPLLSTSDLGQITTIESLAGLADLPCTPIAAGVEARPETAPITTDVSIVAFPARGTVTLLFPLDADTNVSNFQLKELSIDNGVAWIALKTCADPPIFPDPAGTDSCIKSQTTVTRNGTKYIQDVLLVQGSPPDGHYGG
jgi:hypothetical protein